MASDGDWFGDDAQDAIYDKYSSDGAPTSFNFDQYAMDYHDHKSAPMLNRIAELEYALEQEHRQSWATDIPYEPHPLLAIAELIKE